MTDVSDNGKSPTCRLPGGLFVVLGEDKYENGELRYPGTVGVKYGSAKTDWVRMTYSDFVVLTKFALQNKARINRYVQSETSRQKVEGL